MHCESEGTPPPPSVTQCINSQPCCNWATQDWGPVSPTTYMKGGGGAILYSWLFPSSVPVPVLQLTRLALFCACVEAAEGAPFTWELLVTILHDLKEHKNVYVRHG